MKIKAILSSLDAIIQVFSFLVVAYFLGLLISRIGSFLDSFVMKDSEQLKNKNKWFYIESAPYKNYIAAEREDAKILIIASQANLYRSLIGMFLVLIILYGIEIYLPNVFVDPIFLLIVLISMIIVFWLAWKKQVKYVRQRVEKHMESK